MRPRLDWLLAAILLACFALLSYTSKLRNCNTFDETVHLANGASFWLTGDMRMAPEAILLQRWLSLPLVVGDYQFPTLDQTDWFRSYNWGIANQYFFEIGNDADAMLRSSRAMNLVLSVILGLVVFVWSRGLFGSVGGLCSLAAFCFCPTMLAHGTLATPDIGTALFFMFALAGLWSILHRVTPWTMLASISAVAALLVCKMSAVLIIPIGMLLLGVRLLDGRPLPIALGKVRREVQGRWREAVVFVALALLHILAAWAVIWTVFNGRYEIFLESVPGRDVFNSGSWEEASAELGRFAPLVNWARATRFLPEAYLYAFANTLRLGRGVNAAFLNGEVSASWPGFFPYCFLVKTPIPTLGLLGLAMYVWLRGIWTATKRRQALVYGLYRSAPLWILFTTYWLIAINTRINIGQRHLLPVYPVLFIWVGAAASLRARRARLLPMALLLALAIETLLTWPHYLGYFNAFAGGSKNGYRHLVDSSLDWGQDLPGLAGWLKQNRAPDTPLYLSYFGTAKPEYYGIEPTMYLPSYDTRQLPSEPTALQPGIYCVSATMLQPVYRTPHVPWNPEMERAYQTLRKIVEDYQRVRTEPRQLESLLRETGLPAWEQVFQLFEQARFGRLCHHLLQREPDAHVGYSILIYRMDESELKRALFGDF